LIALIASAPLRAAFANTPEPTVVLDASGIGDFAEKTCRAAKAWMKDNGRLINQLGCKAVTGCDDIMPQFIECLMHNPHAEARRFEERLMALFTFNPKCKGGMFDIYYGPSDYQQEKQSVLDNPHWTLIIDYVVGQQQQGWWLDYGAGSGTQHSIHKEGVGTSDEIADNVCSIINGLGGKVR
jgi:hypothetical protein